MSIGAKDYGLIGYNVISDLVDMADLDGNIKFDENYLPDMEFYQDKECAFSAKRIKALILACHLEHHEGEDCLMQFIDRKNSQTGQKKILNRISRSCFLFFRYTQDDGSLRHIFGQGDLALVQIHDIIAQ